MDKLNTELRQSAVDLGLCAQWQGDWTTDKNALELIEMWKRGIDFAIKHQYPSNEFIKANFDKKLLNECLVFVDDDINLEDASSGIYVLNGECRGRIVFEPWSVATVYIRHSSNVNIIAKSFSKVFIRLFDEAEVNTRPLESATIRIRDKR